MISRWEKIFLGLSTLLVAATGLLYAWMKYLQKPADPFSVVNHPWQPGMLSAHVLAAPLLLFAFGLIARDHILGRYRDPRARKGRPSGLAALSALVPMVTSGYLLQVMTSSGDRRAAALVHLGSGIVFLAAYGWHLGRAGGRIPVGENVVSQVGPTAGDPAGRTALNPERLAPIIASGRAGKGALEEGRQ